MQNPSVNIELTAAELRHLRYIIGGQRSFDSIRNTFQHEFLNSLFSKLIAAEKEVMAVINPISSTRTQEAVRK